MVREIR
jgi:hypothetical protein